MEADFKNGFIIREKPSRGKKTKPKIPVYEIKEVKEAEHCPYCFSTYIKKKNHGKYVSRWVYAIVNGAFAKCNLLRWEYHCYDCIEYTDYFNTEVPDAYKNTDSFSENFIKEALLYWLNDKKRTLRKTATDIGINHVSLSTWNKRLSETFSSETPPPFRGPLVFSSFTDTDKKRRGFIGELTSSGLVLKDFLDEYTTDWIREYLSRIPNNERDYLYEIPEVYYSYAPGLGECLHSFFKLSKIGINHHSLLNQIEKHFPMMPEENAKEMKKAISKTLFTAKDNYSLLQVPREIKSEILKLPQTEWKDFKDLIEEKECPYLTNTFQFNTRLYDTSALREEINGMTGKHQSYYTIKVRYLYDRKEFKEAFEEALDTTAAECGARFDFLTEDSIRVPDLLKERKAESDFTFD